MGAKNRSYITTMGYEGGSESLSKLPFCQTG